MVVFKGKLEPLWSLAMYLVVVVKSFNRIKYSFLDIIFTSLP